MIRKIQEPISVLTHFIGFLFSIPLLIFFIQYSKVATVSHMIAMSVFGAALILLYGASTLYHLIPKEHCKKTLFRRIDHMMIFVLIAGTYTPVCLIVLEGVWGYSLLCIIWFTAIVGIILKAFWINAPRFVSTAIYIIMGWLVIFAFYPLVNSVSLSGVMLLVSGGVIYTLGAVIYALKWPKFNLKLFGFHEIFHIFVMGGSALHILFMFMYVL